ncbi:uncharacterized protein [Hyperolius riggenbachi]|uniref:uncharacterized protein n=1 Tax=Hyperolius riggenbachi TaxID=752182 RepID=UPI0035A28BB0
MFRSTADAEIRQALATYSPGSTRGAQHAGYTRVCLQLFGLSGHGKSSLINSCLCVVKNDVFSNTARSANSNVTITMARKEYKLANCVYIIDNRGLNTLAEEEVLELSAQLNNLRMASSENEEATGKDSDVEWEPGVEKILSHLDELINKNCTDFLVPVLVYNLKSTIIQKNKQQFEKMIDTAYGATGLHPIIVLTKHEPYYSIGKVVYQFTDLGCLHIIPLENYTPQNPRRNPETDEKILNFLKVCLQEADRLIQRKHNPDLRKVMMRKIAARIVSEEEKMKVQLESLKKELQTTKEKVKDEMLKKMFKFFCYFLLTCFIIASNYLAYKTKQA